MQDGCVDAVVTDPPYSSGGATRGDRSASPRAKYAQPVNATADKLPHFDGDNRDQLSQLYWCALWLAQALRLTAEGGIVGCFTDWRQLTTAINAVQVGGWVLRGVAPWCKVNARPQKGRISAGAEYLVWGSSGSMGRVGNGVSTPGYVEEIPPRGAKRMHLTQKLERVMEWALGPVALGGTVLDPFMGSGSTGVACLKTGRVFVGIDQQEAYCEIAAKRLEETQREL